MGIQARAHKARFSSPESFSKSCERRRVRPSRKASSRAIPVITTTSIFVKSLSTLSSTSSTPLPSIFSSFFFFFRLCFETDRVPSISRFINSIGWLKSENGEWYFPNYKFLRGLVRASSRHSQSPTREFLSFSLLFPFHRTEPRASFSLPP